jgi:hypothetical protein
MRDNFQWLVNQEGDTRRSVSLTIERTCIHCITKTVKEELIRAYP